MPGRAAGERGGWTVPSPDRTGRPAAACPALWWEATCACRTRGAAGLPAEKPVSAGTVLGLAGCCGESAPLAGADAVTAGRSRGASAGRPSSSTEASAVVFTRGLKRSLPEVTPRHPRSPVPAAAAGRAPESRPAPGLPRGGRAPASSHRAGERSPGGSVRAPQPGPAGGRLVDHGQVGAGGRPGRRSHRGAGRWHSGQAPAQQANRTCSSPSSCHKLRPTPPDLGSGAASGSESRARPRPA
jgi:hypothetical protein